MTQNMGEYLIFFPGGQDLRGPLSFEIHSTLYVSPKDSVLPVEDRAIAFPSVCFCVVFIKIQNTAFWQHCIYGEYAFSKLTKPLHLHMHRVNSSTTGFPSRIVPTKHIVCWDLGG